MPFIQTPSLLHWGYDMTAHRLNAGNGDYMPTEASVLYDHALRQAYQAYDMNGVAL
jgi:hypothetical protein